MTDELQKFFSCPTASIPDTGRVCFRMGRGSSYDAANRGDFGEIIEVGGLKKVLTAPLRAKLKLEAVS
jgi:hypothetical protein